MRQLIILLAVFLFAPIALTAQTNTALPAVLVADDFPKENW